MGENISNAPFPSSRVGVILKVVWQMGSGYQVEHLERHPLRIIQNKECRYASLTA